MATSYKTPPNNSVNVQNNETARAKYNLVSFSAILCKTTTSNEHLLSVVDNVFVRSFIFFGEFGTGR